MKTNWRKRVRVERTGDITVRRNRTFRKTPRGTPSTSPFFFLWKAHHPILEMRPRRDPFTAHSQFGS